MNELSDNTHENLQSRNETENLESPSNLPRRESHFQLPNSPPVADSVHELMGVSEVDRKTIEEMKEMSKGEFSFGSFDNFNPHTEDEPPFKKMKVEESFIPTNDELSLEANSQPDRRQVKAEDVILDDIDNFGQDPTFSNHVEYDVLDTAKSNQEDDVKQLGNHSHYQAGLLKVNESELPKNLESAVLKNVSKHMGATEGDPKDVPNKERDEPKAEPSEKLQIAGQNALESTSESKNFDTFISNEVMPSSVHSGDNEHNIVKPQAASPTHNPTQDHSIPSTIVNTESQIDVNSDAHNPNRDNNESSGISQASKMGRPDESNVTEKNLESPSSSKSLHDPNRQPNPDVKTNSKPPQQYSGTNISSESTYLPLNKTPFERSNAITTAKTDPSSPKSENVHSIVPSSALQLHSTPNPPQIGAQLKANFDKGESNHNTSKTSPSAEITPKQATSPNSSTSQAQSTGSHNDAPPHPIMSSNIVPELKTNDSNEVSMSHHVNSSSGSNHQPHTGLDSKPNAYSSNQEDSPIHQPVSHSQPASNTQPVSANSPNIPHAHNASNIEKVQSSKSTTKNNYPTGTNANAQSPTYNSSNAPVPNQPSYVQPQPSKPYSPSFNNYSSSNNPSPLHYGTGPAPVSSYGSSNSSGSPNVPYNHTTNNPTINQISHTQSSSTPQTSSQPVNNNNLNSTFQPPKVGVLSQNNTVNSNYGINDSSNFSNSPSVNSQSRVNSASQMTYNRGFESLGPHNHKSTRPPDNGQVRSSSSFNPTAPHTTLPYAHTSNSASSKPPPVTTPSPPKPIIKRHRLVVIYDKPRFTHMRTHLDSLKRLEYETCTILELGALDKLKEPELVKKKFDCLSLAIEYNDEFEHNLKTMTDFIEAEPRLINDVSEIAYHFHFDHRKKWSEYREFEKQEYKRFLDVLSKTAGNKVVQCSIINKYELGTIYLTERNDLAKLGQEIQEDIQNWPNLKIFDYGENFIRFLPGVRFSDSLEVINIGGGFSLETLTGFKMPPNLKALFACSGSISSIDTVVFPSTLERLSLVENKLYFLNLVEFPSRLVNLDISQNRIESLKGVNFPRTLKSLAVSFNPIECIRGAKFPEGLEYLDVSCIPNESMTGVKFPESLVSLNLQQSMTNTRGLKLPSFLKRVNLGNNGVNSINPLKLPNTIESLYLSHNNIKTLNKVVFPPGLKELYLGNNLITTLKNVQFPAGLEVLDFEMDPDTDDQEKHITTLKDVIFPPSLKILKLGYHSIKFIETIEFPPALISLNLAYNELKVIRNVKFGNNLKILDLSGNQELTNIDNLIIPESVVDLKIPASLVNFLPPYIVERANRRQLMISKSNSF